MKKIFSILLITIISLSLVSCGSNKTWKPKSISIYNKIYRSTDSKSTSGSEAVINISKVQMEGNDILIMVGAPGIKEITYAHDNYMSFKVYDENGKELGIDESIIEEAQDYVNITLKGEFENVKWLQILPYKSKEDYATFEVEK